VHTVEDTKIVWQNGHARGAATVTVKCYERSRALGVIKNLDGRADRRRAIKKPTNGRLKFLLTLPEVPLFWGLRLLLIYCDLYRT